MIKIFLIPFVWLMLLTGDVAGQETDFGIKTGFNLSILSGSVNRDPRFKPGAHFGGFIDRTLSDNIHFQPELFYSSQGARTYYGTPSIKTGETIVTLHYFILPLILKIYAGEVFNFQIGPQVGALIGAREKGTINGLEVDENVTSSFKTFDFSISGGFGLDITEAIDFGMRVNYGVSNIGNVESILGNDAPITSNRVVHFFAGFSF